jgi:N-acetylglucosaminyldiphosphoundecaprenol N-acetyl-beta-D-mannosaminyltransferase
MKPERCVVFGVGVDPLGMDAMVRAADDVVKAARQCAIFAVNPEKIMAAQADASLCAALNAAEYLIPDGIGAVIAARLRGATIGERVPGSELMPRLCQLAQQRGYRVFLFGAREATNAAAARRLVELYPGLQIAGRHHGYVDAAGQGALVTAINAVAPHFLFVALGSPKQERWIAHNRDRLRVNVIQGVGGTFDVVAGAVRRAPPLWIRLHLEWLYRLLAQPSRLKRQAPLLRFAWLVLTGRLSDRPLAPRAADAAARLRPLP